MTSLFSFSSHGLTIALVASGLTLSACATKPDRKGPPRDGDRPERQARQSGTFAQPVAMLLVGMDQNNDQLISRAEMELGVGAEWGRFGRNPSATSFAQWSVNTLGSTDARPTFMNFDQDFNGVITEAEFKGEFDTIFAKTDKNKDGNLTRSEMIIAFEAPMGRAQQQQGGRGGGERGQRGGGRPPRQ